MMNVKSIKVYKIKGETVAKASLVHYTTILITLTKITLLVWLLYSYNTTHPFKAKCSQIIKLNNVHGPTV